eukprot:7213714-Alexandrium_andersonii.AAC.1
MSASLVGSEMCIRDRMCGISSAAQGRPSRVSWGKSRKWPYCWWWRALRASSSPPSVRGGADRG